MPRFVIDPSKATATHLGTLQGASGAVLAVLVDGARASEWAGWDGSEDGRNRTKLQDWEDAETGTECLVSSAGSASVWKVDDGIVLLEFFPSEAHADSKDELRQLAFRVAQLPTKGKPKSEGFVQVKSGCIAAMLEYADASGATKALKQGAKSLVRFHSHGVLIPLSNGRYEIVTERLEHSDELGLCESRTRIVPVAAKAKHPAKPLAKQRAVDVDTAGARSETWGWTRGLEPFEFVALDAADANRYDGDGDFERAFTLTGKRSGGAFTTGAGAEGVVGKLGLGLAVTFWKLPDGVALVDVDYDPKKLELQSKGAREVLGAYVAQLPAAKSERVGTVTVRSGALCIMRTMAHPKSAPRPTGDKPKMLTQGAGFEVGAAFPIPNGAYEVHRDVLGDERKGLVTDVGRLHVRLRFLRSAKGTPPKPKTAPAPKPKFAAKSAAKGRIHSELSEGTSNKFWETWVVDSTLHVRFGRIGTNGQTKPKKFPTPAAAAAERDALVAAKRKKGYA